MRVKTDLRFRSSGCGGVQFARWASSGVCLYCAADKRNKERKYEKKNKERKMHVYKII
jgi:hypothetical protein